MPPGNRSYGGTQGGIYGWLLSERPEVFVQNELNILPVQNGLYVVFKDSKNECYYRFHSELEEIEIEQHTSGVDLQAFDTYPVGRSMSESQAIDFAYISSLLRSFCGCTSMHLTVRGRLFSDQFSFDLPGISHTVSVSNVQIEVDAGYESEDSIVLIEGKIGRRSDFHARQLFYPYLQWSTRTKKRVRPIFLTYSNGEYMLTEFRVGTRVGDLSIVANRAFVINDSSIATINLIDLLNAIPAGDEPSNIPFPQANDMDKVVDLIQLVDRGVNQKSTIAEFFEFDERQSDYYANAAAYLGFISRGDGGFQLSLSGQSFLSNRSRTQRTRAIVSKLLERPVFRQSLLLLKQRQFELFQISDKEFADIIENSTTLTGTTPARRASTVRRWLLWVLKNSSLGANQ